MSDRTLLLLQARVAFVLVGALLFGYGARVDHPTWRGAGIAMFAVSLLLRWWPGARPGREADGDETPPGDGTANEPREP